MKVVTEIPENKTVVVKAVPSGNCVAITASCGLMTYTLGYIKEATPGSGKIAFCRAGGISSGYFVDIENSSNIAGVIKVV